MSHPGPEMSTPTAEPYRVLWAKSKPRHPLWKHLLDSMAVSLALRNPLEDVKWSPQQVALIVGTHDIGKADMAFQHQVPEFSQGLMDAGYPADPPDARCRHERLSARFVRTLLAEDGGHDFAISA